jgi:DNA-binding SARP family transcriptional activator/tetratricopeptide (TPR) repeat protein/TolB-like protein
MFSLKLFGGVSLMGDDGPVAGPAAQRRRIALLSLLAAASEGGISREKLVGYLWPDTASDQARRFLADSVYALRKALGQEAILGQGDNLSLNPVLVRSDVVEFRQALARGDRHAAVAQYQGPFLDGLYVPGMPEFEHWVEAEREHCARVFAQTIEALAEEREAEADSAGALGWWRRLAAHDPYSSRVALRLMQALEAAGDPGGALQHERVHAALLREALDIEPDAEVVALAERMRSPAVAPPNRDTTRSSQPLISVAAPHAEPASALPGAGEFPAEREREGPRPASDPGPATPPTSAGRGAAEPVRRSRRVMRAALLLLLGGMLGAAVVVLRSPTPKSERVFVAVFENQTGDPTLDPLGQMAADWIARGLLQTGSLEVVAPGARPDAQGEGERGNRALAEKTGAGTMISGAYYREGDILRWQVQVTDATRGILLQTLAPLRVPADSATAGVELLRQQVAAVLASRFDWSQELREITTRSEPPSYDAYLAYVEGIQLFGLQIERAVERFDRAWALDSTFYSARLFSILGNTQLRNLPRADSMLRGLLSHREALSPFERAFLDRSRSDLAGDRAGALRAARRMTDLTPGSQFILGHAAQAVWSNRPREATEVLRRLDPKFGLIPGHAAEEFMTAARHMLGEHRQELRGARQSRLQQPGLLTFWWEVRALVALGRVGEAERLLEESLTLPPQPGWTAADLLRNAGAELSAHGYAEAATRTWEKALVWYALRPEAEQPGHRHSLARTLYEASRWPEARALFEQLAAEQTGNVQFLGHLGTLAARRDDREEAERLSAALAASAQPYLRGGHTLWRARIAAQLGEREQAVHLLREAFAQGQPSGVWVHTDPDLRPLRNLSAFRELIRPKG